MIYVLLFGAVITVSATSDFCSISDLTQMKPSTHVVSRLTQRPEWFVPDAAFQHKQTIQLKQREWDIEIEVLEYEIVSKSNFETQFESRQASQLFTLTSLESPEIQVKANVRTKHERNSVFQRPNVPVGEDPGQDASFLEQKVHWMKRFRDDFNTKNKKIGQQIEDRLYRNYDKSFTTSFTLKVPKMSFYNAFDISLYECSEADQTLQDLAACTLVSWIQHGEESVQGNILLALQSTVDTADGLASIASRIGHLNLQFQQVQVHGPGRVSSTTQNTAFMQDALKDLEIEIPTEALKVAAHQHIVKNIARISNKFNACG